jgi:hypothetical protein
LCFGDNDFHVAQPMPPIAWRREPIVLRRSRGVFEQPLMILFFAALAVGAAAIAFVQTQHRYAFWSLIVAVVVSALLLLAERMIVTPGEQVRLALRTVAARLEANDINGVLDGISPQAEAMRNEVRTRMRQFKVLSVSIKPNLKVTVGPQRPPRTAEARFNAVATLNVPGGGQSPWTIPRRLVVRFRREGEAWQITEYESYDPIGR